MAYNFDPGAGLMGSEAGSGVLANPIQNPIGQPAAPQGVPPNWQEVLKRLAGLWGAQGQLQPAMYKAMALRQDKPYSAKGLGPLGIRIGEGPGGWAVSIGDFLAGLHGRKLQEAEDTKAAEAMKQMAGASGDYAQEKLRHVPQGVPMSNPLGF